MNINKVKNAIVDILNIVTGASESANDVAPRSWYQQNMCRQLVEVSSHVRTPSLNCLNLFCVSHFTIVLFICEQNQNILVFSGENKKIVFCYRVIVFFVKRVLGKIALT